MPDLVILAFYAQNVVRNNYSVLELEGNRHPKPFFDLDNGMLVEVPFSDPTPAAIALGRRLGASFRLYSWFRDSVLQVPVAHRLLFRLGLVEIVPQQQPSAAPSESTVWRWPGRWMQQTEVYMYRTQFFGHRLTLRRPA